MNESHHLPAAAQSHVEPDDIGVGMFTVLGSLVAVALLLAVVLLQAWFYNWKDALVAERISPTDEQNAPAAVARGQLERIENYGWVDAKKKIRAIPITKAMELVVAEYSNGAESPAVPRKEEHEEK